MWGRIRATLGEAANRVVNLFRSRAVDPPAAVEEEASESSSMTSVEDQQARDAIRAELQAGYQLVNERLATVKKELKDLEDENEKAAEETEHLVHGEDVGEGAHGSGLHRSVTAEDLSVYSTPAGLEVIPEEESEVNNNLSVTPDWERGDAVGYEDEDAQVVTVEPARGRVRFDLTVTPLRRTQSIRHGARPRVRGTPHHHVSRVLELNDDEGDKDGDGTDDLLAPDGVVQEGDLEDTEGEENTGQPDGCI